MAPHADLLDRVARSQVRFIDLQFTDVVGAVKSVTIPAARLGELLDHGLWFDGSSVEGFARIAENDLCLMADLATFAVLPWLMGDEATGRLLCRAYTLDGEPFLGDPRGALARVIAQAAELGYIYHSGAEVEFFLLKPGPPGTAAPPEPSDPEGYFDAPGEVVDDFRRQLVSALAPFGIAVHSMHHEVAPGQHEIDFREAEALTAADQLATFRYVLKTIAQRNGLYGTVVPKPLRGSSGSGMHVHQSLAFKSGGRNAFFDPGDPHGLSQTAKHFVAGQLAHARAMCAVLAPLINSYKRLGAGYEAPVHISWARLNRAALIRVPRAHRPEATRVELRCPDSGGNPYLALAVMLAAGLDGIRRRLALPLASDENLFRPGRPLTHQPDTLPRSLEDALEALEQDAVIQEALGKPIHERFVAARRLELRQYAQDVSSWELARHLAQP